MLSKAKMKAPGRRRLARPKAPKKKVSVKRVVTGVVFSQMGHKNYRSRISDDSGKRLSKRFVDFFEAICWRKSMEIKLNYHMNHGVVRLL